MAKRWDRVGLSLLAVLIATAAESADLRLRWTYSEPLVGNFQVWRSTTGDTLNFVRIANAPQAIREWVDINLVTGQQYYYFVKACGVGGCSPESNRVWGTAAITLPPSSPGAVTAAPLP
jgi:hypothetical protein